MSAPAEVPGWLADLLDKPLVGPVALIALGAVFVLWCRAIITRGDS